MPGSESSEDVDEPVQQRLDLFSEMNRYDERGAVYPSSEVYEHPRRTLHNYWVKFHAARDCGAAKVSYLEETTHRSTGEKYEYRLFCWSCGHDVEEDEVLFIGGDWYSRYGWEIYRRAVEDVRITEDRVLELGPDPDREALERVLRLSRIEREASVFGVSFGNEQYRECEDCGQETILRFDDRCRMCYDDEWTENMTETIETLAIQVRERNGSYRHRLPNRLDPVTPGAGTGKMLWRRHDAEATTKLVEVVQRFEDVDSGERYYQLTDPTHTEYWTYHEDDLVDCFWYTGLYNKEVKPVMDDRIREVYQRVCGHAFNQVYDEAGLPTGEECIHCRKSRPLEGDR